MKSTIITIIFGIIVLMNSHLLPMFSRLSVLRTLCCFLLLPMLSKLSVMPLDPPTTGVRFSVEDLEEANIREIFECIENIQTSETGKKSDQLPHCYLGVVEIRVGVGVDRVFLLRTGV